MFEELKKQELLFELWKLRENRDTLDKEQLNILNAMEEHKEYHDFFNSANVYEALNQKFDHNPFLHIILHSVLQNQLDSRKPPEVYQAYNHLTIKKKLDPHKAKHSLSVILADELFNTMKHKKPFDEKKYAKRMKKFLKM